MKHLDLLFASVMCITGGFLSVVSYNQIEKQEKRGVPLIPDKIQAGNHLYKIISNNECVGEVRILLSDFKSTTIVSKGYVTASLDREKFNIAFKVNAYFNPLGQMSEASATVSGRDIKITTSAVEVNPIKLKVAASSPWGGSQFSLSLKGPILITKTENGRFTLEYSQLNKQHAGFLSLPAAYFKSQLNYKLVNGDDEKEPNCRDSRKQGAIALDAVMSAVRYMTNSKGAISQGLSRIL
ncbi:MAG: hypothetical protein D6808_00480 [Candidatus Dadabacteria bacterium]|nr:MAG: hypothetical protein D6808_00480 [Candidatus Dadabacteria bacterium]